MLLYFFIHGTGQDTMPSSVVQMEAGAPVSLFLNKAVKRKPDDEAAANWDRECGLKVRAVSGREWNTVILLLAC